jgi:hypothetical protein
MKQFVDNLKRVEKVVVDWSIKKEKEDRLDLLATEEAISWIYNNNHNGFFSYEDLSINKVARRKKTSILGRRRSCLEFEKHVIWLEEGDNNTIFFLEICVFVI